MLVDKSFILLALAAPLCTATLNTASTAWVRCKPLPSSPNWPSADQWRSLNASINGRLEAVASPGAVCHPSQAAFNPTTCNLVAAQWLNTSFHASNPWSVDYNDDTCLPNATAPCSPRGYPAFAVKAHDASDVQQAVNFVRDTDVRLVIKGTGHDYLGRSTGPGTLELWTHELRGLTFSKTDTRVFTPGAAGTVKIAAGMRWGEVYGEAVKHNVTPIGGGDLNVGVAGWILHGGHSPISSLYGLGVDQVVEMEVVTADGRYRIINTTSDSDLFWAMRGGGAGTFAVLLSVTVQVYPSLPGTTYVGTLNTTENSDTFWSLAAHFSSNMPSLSDAGGMGYYYPVPFNANPDPVRNGGIYVSFIFPNKSPKEVGAILSSLITPLTNASWAMDRIFSNGSTTQFQDFITHWLNNTRGDGGHNTRLGSWLLGDDGLNGNIQTLKESLRTATDPTYGSIGHVVAGKGVRDAKILGGSNAVLPAWRSAYVHFVTPRRWPALNLTQKSLTTTETRDVAMPALRKLQPASGAYMNEADPTNPQWRENYYGATYPRLLQVKQRWDPEGVFYCRPCVGHEFWEIVDGPAEEDRVEWGVGQTGGRFCRKG